MSQTAARSALRHVAQRSLGPRLDRELRITVNFHPDVEIEGAAVLALMARDGRYRSQFETGISNGGLTAYPGGQRWQWEHRIFGGAYDGGPASQRPIYGALDHRRSSVGGAVRFGAAYLRLTPEVLDRATFCFPDSVLEPHLFGTSEHFDLFTSADSFAAISRDEAGERAEGGHLDSYVEAHVHGGVVLRRDVEALVLDPCYRGSPVEEMAHRIRVPLEWHEGRVLEVDELRRHPTFRGPEAVTLGDAIAVDEKLTARIIGEQRPGGRHDPQRLKELWHLVARFGRPAA